MGNLVLTGATSGSATVQATDAQTVTITLPATSGTLALTSGGGSPSFTSVTTTSDSTFNTVTVGKGGGNDATSVVVGSSTLSSSNTGTDNNAFGVGSLLANTTGSYGSAFGRAALRFNTTGNYNTAFGANALIYNTTASGNTAVGYQAGYSNTTGSITALGYTAGNQNTTGGSNTFLGNGAGYWVTTGSYNTFVGSRSTATAGITGSSNSCFGDAAGYALTGGADSNCLIGQYAGGTITSGTNNTCLGTNTQPSTAAGTYQLVIASGGGTGKGNSTGFITPAGGSMYQGNNSASWATTSDQRLKKNIVDNTVGLSAITAIQVRNFEYRTADEVTELEPQNAIDIKGVQLGVIAQELQAILPECVKEESTGVMSVDTTNLTWYLINAVKELNTKVTALEAQLGAK